MFDKCGSAYYMAPEILKGSGYTEDVDIWAAGCIMYVMLKEEMPFDGETDAIIFEKIKNEPVSMSKGK